MSKIKLFNTFRHRNHPRTLKREDLNVQASDTMNESEIQKKYRI